MRLYILVCRGPASASRKVHRASPARTQSRFRVATSRLPVFTPLHGVRCEERPTMTCAQLPLTQPELTRFLARDETFAGKTSIDTAAMRALDGSSCRAVTPDGAGGWRVTRAFAGHLKRWAKPTRSASFRSAR